MRVRLRSARGEPGGETATENRSAESREPAAQSPRSWNLWELDRLARAANGDARAEEERRLLLLHLRDFADSSGQLPVEFDPLVRETFGPTLAELS